MAPIPETESKKKFTSVVDNLMNRKKLLKASNKDSKKSSFRSINTPKDLQQDITPVSQNEDNEIESDNESKLSGLVMPDAQLKKKT